MRFIFSQDIIQNDQGQWQRVTLTLPRTTINLQTSDDRKLRALSAQFQYLLKRHFSRVFYPTGRIDRNNILNRIDGYLGIESPDTGRYAEMQNISAEQLTPENLKAFLETRIYQSNWELDFNALVWTFVINDRSYIVGGGKILKIDYPTNLYKLCYQEFSDNEGPINCAAFALNYKLFYRQRNYPKTSLDRVKVDARAFQTEMGWGPYVALSELEKVVQVYKDIRLTVILPGTDNFRYTTFEGPLFDHNLLSDENQRQITSAASKVVYIVFDYQHYFPISSPSGYFKKVRKTNDIGFCHKCVEVYRSGRVSHNCEDWLLQQQPEKKKRIWNCEFCNQRTDKAKCSCNMARCWTCNATHKSDETHRCIVIRTGERKTSQYDMGNQEGKAEALWAYDIEARVEIRVTENQVIDEFDTEEDRFTGDVTTYSFETREHKANLVVAKNVFTGETKVFEGDSCIIDFLFFMGTYNKGKNICYAHNASGYDTRLIFDNAININSSCKTPILRGCKFIQFKINDICFRDTLLHLQGSLRSLAKEYCSNVQLEKGYFPHLFNSIENYNYVGSLPPIDKFDLTFAVKTAKDLQDFYTWYNSWEGRTDWCFQTELRKYCINDVDVLAAIMLSHHNILVEKLDMSPWINTTAPSYVHEVYLRYLYRTLELPDRKEDPTGYSQRIHELAHEEYWAVLQDEEYLFARLALRGGRTEIRKVYHKVSDEDWARGVRIRYQDICSQYPYQQAVHDFPVGTPTIFVWDNTCYPCVKCTTLNCKCNTPRHSPKLTVIDNVITPNQNDLLDPTWFGIVCCTIDPPKDLYHPVLVAFDQELNKSVASCRRIEKGVFTSVEFQQALKVGYKIVKLHRFDRYNKRPSLWGDVIKDLFIEKMVNSNNEPSEEEKQRLKKEYEEKFGMGDDLQKTFDEKRWGKNPAKKKTFKIMINSGWGKHCQRPNMIESKIIDRNNSRERLRFFDNVSNKNFNLKNVVSLNADEDLFLYNKDRVKLDLHGGYLPAGLFVPAYGRLHLWEQLYKLGKRVLMNDTDSIIYLYDPLHYNIPQGDIWGEWEVEDIDSKNGGIVEFVGVGPKTYSLLCFNGNTQTKCKGMSLSRTTQNLVNHDTMRTLVYEDGVVQTKTLSIKVPQQSFVYKLGKGITTYKMLKELSFNRNDLKGVLDEEGYLYPFGYEIN
jgi:hypothetical protein